MIGHQVNCKGVMGLGLAKQIRNKYPFVYDKYKEICKYQNKGLLGTCQLVTSKDKFIANLFGQVDYGRDNKLYTDYNALEKSLIILSGYSSKTNKTIGLPYGIGCGLAGGDWEVVSKIIDDIFDEVYIYKL